MDRIISAFTFKREVYSEVEHDTSFTQTAWIIVAVVSLLAQAGTLVSADSIGNGIIAALIGTAGSVLAFALSCWAIAWAGKTFFKADVSFEEMVRTLGLAYVWRVVGVLGLAGFIPALACVLAPIQFIAWILWVVSWAFAAKEALDLEWIQTVISVVVGFVVVFIINVVIGLILGVLGLGAAAAGSLLGG